MNSSVSALDRSRLQRHLAMSEPVSENTGPRVAGNTKSNVFFYSSFAPLVQVPALATAQVEYLAP